MDREYRGFLLKRDPYNMIKIEKAGRGGSKPNAVKGRFLSIKDAERAVDSYLAGKQRNDNSKE